MKIAILGYSLEGRSSYEYFTAQGGHELTICDADTGLEVPDGAASVLGPTYLDNLDRFDLIVRTAGLQPSAILEKNPGVADKITSNLNEFLKVCPTSNVIGVTGTKGKGTTSTLISLMLKAAGKSVELGGNIGIPALSMLPRLNADSWVVLELSSFQLIDIKASPHIAVCLMVVPEHLNWHADTDEYYQAKAELFARQQGSDIAVYFADNENSRKIAEKSPGQKIPYFKPPGAYVENDAITIDGQAICQTRELSLLGAHNWQNICAAVTAVWHVQQDAGAIKSALAGFTGLPHRLELVRELDGVKYYDDSFGTTPQTAMVAIEAFTQPKIVILGGQTKGIPFDELAETVASNNVKNVITIGDTAGEIEGCLERAGYKDYVRGGGDITEIVGQARELASPGDVVLLSTGCASFDMFKNYKDRAEKFVAAVKDLS